MDPLIRLLSEGLPSDVVEITQQYISWLESGDYHAILGSEDARTLFGHATGLSRSPTFDGSSSWSDFIFDQLTALLSDRSTPGQQIIYFCMGYAALLSFVQANVTGPPLPFVPRGLLFSETFHADEKGYQGIRHGLLAGLSLDGIAAYKLVPQVELLCLAEAIMTCPPILKHIKPARWVKMRVTFMHQRLLSEVSSTLQGVIYDDMAFVEEELAALPSTEYVSDALSEFLLEKATIHLHHGNDKLARTDLGRAQSDRHFLYALTGRLGKRTKYQQHDVSQLVVLAKSAAGHTPISHETRDTAGKLPKKQRADETESRPAQPEALDLNDDTLLEKIAFSENILKDDKDHDGQPLPSELSSLDPSNQPQLEPLDASILLSFASSVSNTSPEHGLTREETLPYATRVIDGGSSNWQIYTQALLVRSRVEGYRSRTVERGLLQLQALVDQIIAETTDANSSATVDVASDQSTTFLPRASKSESAPVTERLRYVFQLASPTRWDLEAELAARWVQLGGLRSALDIYERLEMWADAALCYAATEQEDKARRMVRRQLFHSTQQEPGATDKLDDEAEPWNGRPREPVPLDAPRLYCILGDIDQSVVMYEEAWRVSKQRYARAQRSIGRLFFAAKDYAKSAEAYTASLKVNQLNQQSWFALGCAQLELENYRQAVASFSRCVQLDETDAEAWSNLAAALLRSPLEEQSTTTSNDSHEDADQEYSNLTERDLLNKKQKSRVDALKAFQRAASLKHDSYRIWQNVLITAASIAPPDYVSVLSAQKRVIDLRGGTEGEKCVDVEILERLVQYIIASAETYDPSQPGIVRMTVKFIDESIVPLITASAELWRMVSKLALWRNKPASALEAEEKAWRAITSQPGWETESEQRWDDVVEATVRLCDSYESLGSRERTEGLGAGQLVAKDWRFKARTAIRSIMSRGKDSWQDTAGWETLSEAQIGLKQ